MAHLSRLLEVLPVSCLAIPPGREDLLVVGTYALQQDDPQSGTNQPQKRTGSLSLYHTGQGTFDLLDRSGTDNGFLDIEFAPGAGHVLCGAMSSGSIAVFHLAAEAGETSGSSSCMKYLLVPLRELQVFATSILILDLAFVPTRTDIIGVTTSTGVVGLVQTTEKMTEIDAAGQVKVHFTELYRNELEAWTLAFGHFIPERDQHHLPLPLHFGSDDASLGTALLLPPSELSSAHSPDIHLPDLSPSTIPSDPSLVRPPPPSSLPPGHGLTNMTYRTHTAGVTSILPLSGPGETGVVLTGSYDDRIRVVRPGGTPVSRVLAERDLGGGVWRTQLVALRRWTEEEEKDGGGGSRTRERRSWVVLAACMHAGARVVEVRCRDWDEAVKGTSGTDGGFEMEILAKFEGHESMCYSAVVVPGRGRRRRVVSASFYDKLIALWEFEAPEWMADEAD